METLRFSIHPVGCRLRLLRRGIVDNCYFLGETAILITNLRNFVALLSILPSLLC